MFVANDLVVVNIVVLEDVKQKSSRIQNDDQIQFDSNLKKTNDDKKT